MKLVKMFQVLDLGTIWSQNIISVLKVFLLVKFGAATIGCVPLSHNIGYNIFTCLFAFVLFFFLIVTKRVTLFH